MSELDIACPSDSHCYAVGAGGAIFATSDGGDHWSAQASGTGQNLHDVDCATEERCTAVGDGPTIRTTADGGQTWIARTSPTPHYLYGVSCPTSSTCYTATAARGVNKTTNGGATWTVRLTADATKPAFQDISCATDQACVAVGYSDLIYTTSTGGAAWTASSAGTGEGWQTIDCATASDCQIGGLNGGIRSTSNGGASWTASSSGTSARLYGMSCPTALTCKAVGDDGVIRSTVDGGRTAWQPESDGTTRDLQGVACADAVNCWAAGDGRISTTRPATPEAGCSDGKVGASPACVDLGPAPGNPAPSNDCVAPTAAVVIDGYVGSIYARLRTQQVGSETWICTRLQPEGGTEYAGGKLVVGDTDLPVVIDGNHAACAAEPGNVHVTGGQFGDPSDPNAYLPYSLDIWRGDDEAWVCMRAGLGQRVVYGGNVASLQQDNAALAVAPPRTEWTPGVPSADCEAQVGGSKTQLVNAVLGGAQVWATGWRSGSKTMLCFRAQQGSTDEGGRLTIDTTGLPGVQPIAQVASDTTGCPLTVFRNDTADLTVRRSESNDNPASVCVTRGSTTVRLTVGYSATLPNNAVEWRAD